MGWAAQAVASGRRPCRARSDSATSVTPHRQPALTVTGMRAATPVWGKLSQGLGVAVHRAGGQGIELARVDSGAAPGGSSAVIRDLRAHPAHLSRRSGSDIRSGPLLGSIGWPEKRLRLPARMRGNRKSWNVWFSSALSRRVPDFPKGREIPATAAPYDSDPSAETHRVEKAFELGNPEHDSAQSQWRRRRSAAVPCAAYNTASVGRKSSRDGQVRRLMGPKSQLPSTRAITGYAAKARIERPKVFRAGGARLSRRLLSPSC
jgi:hypothetical protein